MTVLLAALHPVSALALIGFGVEPLDLGRLLLAESVVTTVPAAVLTPYRDRGSYRAPQVELRHEGFSTTWAAWSGASERGEASGFGGLIGLGAAAAAVVWVTIGLYASGITVDATGTPEVGAVVVMSVLVALFTGLPAALARAVVNHVLARQQVELRLDGRMLTVGDTRWRRDAEDELLEEDGRLVLVRDGDRLEIRGGAGELSWLAYTLRRTGPPPGDQRVPSELRAILGETSQRP